jgi:uncharacterized protein YdeI (YjbR/CyaY-like superfamily)
MIATSSFKKVQVTSAEQLRQWLLTHHEQQESVWLVTYKKHVATRYVSVQEVLDELLCFGWIDGLRRVLDTDRTMQLISPRRTQVWAKTYKIRAARLITEGRMEPSGLASIADAKQTGLWSAMDDVDALLMPSDLTNALRKFRGATANFAAFSKSSRRNVLRWIKNAKAPETRARRIAQTAELASKGLKVPQM